MFIARRIIPKNKLFTNFISTSNVFSCDEPKDGSEEKAKTPAFSSEKRNKPKSSSQKLKSKAQKKAHLGITINSVAEVAKELSNDVKKTTEEIFNYLGEMEIAKDPYKAKVSEKDVHYELPRPSNSLMRERKKRFTHSLDLNQDMNNTEPQIKLKIWDDLEAEELKFLGKKSPTNCFEEMINWTEEGKLWHFPIDNDQGMEKEAEISFTEHVFLEQYLEPWCPKKGPLRKFMELVLVGLSKNHIYTLEEKKAHIDWFRKYFEEKKKLLQELGAMGSAKELKIGTLDGEEKQ